MEERNPFQCEVLNDFDHGRFGVLARSLQLLLAYGAVDRAIAEVRQFAAATRRQTADASSLLIDVLPYRVAMSLESEGIKTVASFIGMSDSDIERMRGLGPQAIAMRDQLRNELLTGKLMVLEEDDLAFDFFAEVPQAIREFMEQQERKMSSGPISVMDAIAVLAKSGDAATAEIDAKIEVLQKEIDALKKVRSLFGEKPKPKPMALTESHLAIAAKMHKFLSDIKRSAMPKEIAGKVNTTALMVGRIAAADSRFVRYSDGQLGLA